MELKKKVTAAMLDAMSKVFKMEREHFEANLQLSFIEDLKATSIQFFPIIAALEDEFDIELQYQDFRRNGKTIQDAIDFVYAEYEKVYG